MCTPPPLPYCIICASLTIQSGFDCAAQCVWDYFFPSSRSLSSKDKRQRRARIIRQGFWHLVRLRRQCTRYDNWHIFCAVKKPNTCDRFPKFTFRRDVARRFPPNSKRKTGLFETWAQCVEDSWVGGGCSVLKLLTASHDGTVAIAHHSGGGPRVGSHGVSRTTRSHRTDWDHHHHHHHEGGSLFFCLTFSSLLLTLKDALLSFHPASDYQVSKRYRWTKEMKTHTQREVSYFPGGDQLSNFRDEWTNNYPAMSSDS